MPDKTLQMEYGDAQEMRKWSGVVIAGFLLTISQITILNDFMPSRYKVYLIVTLEISAIIYFIYYHQKMKALRTRMLEEKEKTVKKESRVSEKKKIIKESQMSKIEMDIKTQQANQEYNNALKSLYKELKSKLRFLKLEGMGTLGISDVNAHRYVRIYRESNIPFKAYIYEFWKDTEEFYKQYDEYLENLKKFLDAYENILYSILNYHFGRKRWSLEIVNIGKEFEELESQRSLRHPRYLSIQIVRKIIPPLMRNESIDYLYLDDSVRSIIFSDYGDIKEIWEKISKEYSDLYNFHHPLIKEPNYSEIVFKKREKLIREAESIIDKIMKKIYGTISK